MIRGPESRGGVVDGNRQLFLLAASAWVVVIGLVLALDEADDFESTWILEAAPFVLLPIVPLLLRKRPAWFAATAIVIGMAYLAMALGIFPAVIVAILMFQAAARRPAWQVFWLLPLGLALLTLR